MSSEKKPEPKPAEKPHQPFVPPREAGEWTLGPTGPQRKE